MIVRSAFRMLLVYTLLATFLVGAFVFNQYDVVFLLCSLWVVLVVLKIGTWWSKCFPILLVLLCFLTVQDPFRGYRWGLIPVTLAIFHAYLLCYIFSPRVRQALETGLSVEDLTLYMGHRVVGAYSFSKVIDESSAALVATHNPLEVMNAGWVNAAGTVDFVVAFAAPLLAYLLFKSGTVAVGVESATSVHLPRWLLLLVAGVNIVGFADFCVVGAAYSSVLLPGPFQTEGVEVSVIPMTRFPLAVLVMGLAPVSMLFHFVSLHRVVRLLQRGQRSNEIPVRE